MLVEFDKMEGAGNDFILVDNRSGAVPSAVKRSLVADACRRARGIGADGMIFIEPDPELDFAWDFYNSDGSTAEMCGNGARCAVCFARKIGAAGGRMKFRTLAGGIHGEITPRGAKVRLTDARAIGGEEIIDVDGREVKLHFLNTGVPHAVVVLPDIQAVDVPALGRAIRNHPRFAPAGTNVNFISLTSGDSLAIRTYERGVEDETLACGTGTVAAALVAARHHGRRSPLVAVTRGGDELAVHFTLDGEGAREVFLEGGARFVFSGRYDFEGDFGG